MTTVSVNSPVKCLVASLLTFFALDACAGSLIIDQGRLRVEVDPPGLSPIRNTLILNSNPFGQAHNVLYQNTWTAAQYSVSWSGDNADFLAFSQQSLQGIEGRVRSFGEFRITPINESLLVIHAQYEYLHPPGEIGTASVGAQLKLDGVAQPIWSNNAHDGTFGLGSPNGTLTVDVVLQLLAGASYIFEYSMSSNNFGDAPPQNGVWAGNGFVEVTVRPIPEPASVFPLALIFCGLLYRRSARN